MCQSKSNTIKYMSEQISRISVGRSEMAYMSYLHQYGYESALNLVDASFLPLKLTGNFVKWPKNNIATFIFCILNPNI